MLSRIAAEAHAWCKANDWSDKEQNAVIYFGAHAEDAQNWAYPDCTPEFIGSMANAIFIGTYQRVRLVTPFIHSLKSTIVHDGWMLDVPYHLTWSCYAGGEVHCGECPTCIARKEAFTKGNIPDPTVYANTPIDMPHIGQAHDATADVPSDPDEIPF
jgi:7-cyano-7-deazaguanine synthase in queuosine biosynthesis